MPKTMRHHTPNSARIVAVVLSLVLASGAAWYFNSISESWLDASETAAPGEDFISIAPSETGSPSQ